MSKYFDVVNSEPKSEEVLTQVIEAPVYEPRVYALPISPQQRSRTLRVKRRRLTLRLSMTSTFIALMVCLSYFVIGRPNDLGGTVQALTDTMQVSPHDFEPSDADAVREDWRLSIDSIGLNAPIQPIGLTKSGNVGVPTDVRYVGWFKKSPKPGLQGTAVLDGHVSVRGLGSGIFKNLHKLRPGDRITVTESGVATQFEVIKSESYDVNNAPKEKIFGVTDKPLLNLITCSGTWDKGKKDYTERLVVYTKIVI